ncbi:hypothetical protein HOO65_060508 [Ceratocystis lukuohia]|uniref:F-box domain-containing protein n=2 Tax=Ceratocystis TaxID=5157 RepID=A0A2C5X7F6_9PEZI|nr:hypothetical protein CFIMG_008185RA00001 [Ceratocystis fimbriata CBS 114723]
MVQVLVSQSCLPSTADDVVDVANAAARMLLGGSSLSHSTHNHGHGHGLRHTQTSNLACIQESGSVPPHTAAERRAIKAGVRRPRRSQSLSEYDNEQPPVRHLYLPTLAPTLASPTTPAPVSASAIPRGDLVLSSVQETASSPAELSLVAQATPPPPDTAAATLALRMVRPKPRKPPRRAFSLMDDEPIVHTHRPSELISLLDLPKDVLYLIFDFLDPIDSVCFGLASRAFYPIHQRLNGRVSLASRRHGPNTLEWAWRGAGSLRHPGLSPPQSPMPLNSEPHGNSAPSTPTTAKAPQGSSFPGLRRSQTASTTSSTSSRSSDQPESPSVANFAAIRLDGQVYCRKCGTSRCELHSHLKQWMGSEMEYCSVSCRFGRPAPPGAHEVCYRRSPKNPSRCGRHAPRVRASAPVSPRMRPVDLAVAAKEA